MITLFRLVFAPPRHLILLLAALWLGLALSEKRADRHRLGREALNNLIYYSILGFLLGGRVLFVLANLSSFTESPLSIFSINLDLLDPSGAIATALLVGLIYGQRQKLPFWSTLDAVTPLLATLAIGLSLTHLAAGTAFGQPTELPWGLELWNARRHPSQIYELIASLVIFAVIWLRKTDSPPGFDSLSFVAWTAGTRLFLEAFRGDSILIAGGIRLAQVIAWLVLAPALIAREIIQKNINETKSASSPEEAG
jgi:phosphatidylglycerol:prolipoprotein diacylglycerol transferase